MTSDLPPHLAARRSATESQIREAFKGVTRDGGVSWSESFAIDDFESDADCQLARARDKDTHWEQLIDDPSWNDDTMAGGFSFLDLIGLRYYLPPSMIRSLRNCGQTDGARYALGRPSLHRILTPEQAAAVRAFLLVMKDIVDCLDDTGIDGEAWLETYNTNWKNIEANDLEKSE